MFSKQYLEPFPDTDVDAVDVTVDDPENVEELEPGFLARHYSRLIFS